LAPILLTLGLPHKPGGPMFRFGTLCNLINDENGATSIEYAVIASLIGAVLAGTIWVLGNDVKTMLYDKLAAML
jgi:Flp pilus assembly pilin Flp